MSAFDLAEARILTALFIAHHSDHREILTWSDIEARYHTKVSKMHFEAIIAELQSRGVVKGFRDKEGSGAVLLDHGVRFAHDKILEFLDAHSFDVSWKTERIVTDAEGDIDIPCPEGWMVFQVAKDKKAKPAAKRTDRADAPLVAHGISAGRDVIMNVGSHRANAQGSPERLPKAESGWIKWQTALTAAGVLVALAAMAVAWYLANR